MKNENYKQNDSIILWIENSKNKDLDYNSRKDLLNKANVYALKEQNDSLRSIYFFKISVANFVLNDSLGFRKSNKESVRLSRKVGDSVSLGYNYWDLGDFFANRELKDSAYFSYSKAEKIYESLNENYFQGLMLLNMAIIQSDLRDYTGSELTTIKAIELFKPLKKYNQLYRCYNNLGVVLNELQQYDEALFYHNKALEYEPKIESDNTFKSNSLNNIGVVHRNNNQHIEAIQNYNKALKTNNLKQKNSKLYAMLLDNLAFSKFKTKDTIGVKALFQESLQIRDSIGDVSGKTINKLHLAEFHATYYDSIQALKLAIEAKEMAENSKNYRDLLSALMLLSKLDTLNSHQYTQRYIVLNARLLKEERAIRNKFTRIRFETDEFIEKNELLTEQNKLYLIIGFGSLLLTVLIFVLTDQRLKNTKLKLDKEQQKANEEIYNLMLSQQYKLDEGRREEKKRMSEELHDGVLGNLYGIKMNLAVLNPQKDSDAVLKRATYIEDLSNIIDEIRNVSHELNARAIDADVGYLQLIEDFLIEQSKTYNYNYKLLTDSIANWQLIPGYIKVNIYRILQESIHNVNKYAKADNVLVVLKAEDNFIYFTINDDGKGFNPKTKKDGIGIKNIKSRVERLKGSVQFNAEINKGTSILIKIPFNTI